MFFFVWPRVFRAASTDRSETLPHNRNLTEFYKLTSKIREAVPPQKKIGGGGKNMQNFGQFWTTSDLIANISGTAQDIHKRKTLQTMAIPPTCDEKSQVNFGPLTAWNYM